MADTENQENGSSPSPVRQDESNPSSSEVLEKQGDMSSTSPNKLSTSSSTDNSLDPVKETSGTPGPSDADKGDDQHDNQHTEAEHGSYTIYDPTGHYANAYNRRASILDTQQPSRTSNDPRFASSAGSVSITDSQQPLGYTQQCSDSATPSTNNTSTNQNINPEHGNSGSSKFRYGDFETDSTGPHNSKPVSFETGNFGSGYGQDQNHEQAIPNPMYGGFDMDGQRIPLEKPVVIGRVVNQSGVHRYHQNVDAEDGHSIAGNRWPTFRQEHHPYNNANISHGNDRLPHPGIMHGRSDINIFGPLGNDTATLEHRPERAHEIKPFDEHFMQANNEQHFKGAQRSFDHPGPSGHLSHHVHRGHASGSGYPGHPGHLGHPSGPGRPDRPERFYRSEDKLRSSRDGISKRPFPIPGNYHDRAPADTSHNLEAEGFNVFGQRLEPSRYSGAPMPWRVQSEPELINQDEVSDASLMKRNIPRGLGKKICKRGYGASDPENIAIVNMKEFENLPFDDIARILNEKRVQEGKDPSLTSVGVNGRYNRTAPLLFSAQGQEFIPLSKRKGRGKEVYEAAKKEPPAWDDRLDLILVNCVKEVDAAKWATVATLFERKSGKPMDAAAAALRHNLL